MNESVVSYYNQIAPEYDRDRFGNSYGQFIDYQEQRLLRSWRVTPSGTVDLACGTGRLTHFAQMGIDASEEMLTRARKRHPGKRFILASAQETTLEASGVETVICFHLMMHLEEALIGEILQEVHRILQPGGRFIVDFPSARRRSLFRRKRESWHGSTAMDRQELAGLCASLFSVKRSHGIMMLPVHRLPGALRRAAKGIDYALCGSALKPYSSYVVYELTKR